MSFQVTMGAQLACSFGAAPSALTVLPVNRTLSSGVPAANIMDHVPMLNILPFGMCTSLANPTVVAATAAASGVLTPMPCIPVTPSPWVPGAPTVMIGPFPALDAVSTCNCVWGGVISILMAGQFTEQIP
jgi:uncharacterized protein DUF4280